MNAHASEARLTTLFESLKQIQQLITRLSKLPAQPGSSPANPDEGDARIELSAEIHQRLKEQEEEFELIRQEIEDQTTTSSWSSAGRPRNSGRERADTDLAAQITRLGEDLKTYVLRDPINRLLYLPVILQRSYSIQKGPAASQTQSRNREA